MLMKSTALSVMMSAILLMMSIFMYEKKKTLTNSKSQFECGFNSISSKNMLMSIKFIPMMIMFIMFDIEVMVMIPSILMSEKTTSMMMMMSFFCLMSALISMEWFMGSMEWMK